MMLRYRSHGLFIAELWFDDPVPVGGIDVIRYHQRPEPLPDGKSNEFYTLMVDLNRPKEEILAGMDKATRYEIRRASERDGVNCVVLNANNAGTLEKFCAVYETFAMQKRLPGLNPSRLRALAQNKMLDLSLSSASEHGDLVYHAHLICRGRARLLHSASIFRDSTDTSFRALVGRANRLLHWYDMAQFKTQGLAWLDFGGWYEGQEDEERLKINKFKESFGGFKRRDFNGEVAVTLKAKALLTLARWLGRHG
jgi:hypothetical protein